MRRILLPKKAEALGEKAYIIGDIVSGEQGVDNPRRKFTSR